MRLLTYNILDGGEGRADPLIEVMLAARADVVAVVEADVPAVVDRIAKRLDVDVVVAPGNGHSVALFSRWPIVSTVNHAALIPGFERCFLEAIVRSPEGIEVPIAVIHLPAGPTDEDEAKRERSIATVLEFLKPYRDAGRPHLVVGDFNSNAAFRSIDPARCDFSSRDHWKSHPIPVRVIRAMIAADYVDTYHALHAEPTDAVGSFTTQYPGQKVDYIFAFKLPGVAESWIETDRLAKYASDHFPVGADIQMTD